MSPLKTQASTVDIYTAFAHQSDLWHRFISCHSEYANGQHDYGERHVLTMMEYSRTGEYRGASRNLCYPIGSIDPAHKTGSQTKQYHRE